MDNIFDTYPYDGRALEQVYNEAQECVYHSDGTVLEVRGVGQSWFFSIPAELRGPIKDAPRPERLLFLYELLLRGLVAFRDDDNFHIATLNSRIIRKMTASDYTEHPTRSLFPFFDLAFGNSFNEMRNRSPEARFFNHFPYHWELEISFDYSI